VCKVAWRKGPSDDAGWGKSGDEGPKTRLYDAHMSKCSKSVETKNSLKRTLSRCAASIRSNSQSLSVRIHTHMPVSWLQRCRLSAEQLRLPSGGSSTFHFRASLFHTSSANTFTINNCVPRDAPRSSATVFTYPQLSIPPLLSRRVSYDALW
jgi:hypothetical protein